jgi:hypothetical protein
VETLTRETTATKLEHTCLMAESAKASYVYLAASVMSAERNLCIEHLITKEEALN